MGGGRAARHRGEGVTVFLTTQYLEEADRLADRVGIIDHGKIVAEGTPGRAEGRDRPAQRRGRGRRSGRPRPRSQGCSTRFGDGGDCPQHSPDARGRAPDGRRRQRWPTSCARSTEGIAVAHLQLHAPSLDDVFLAKTGRSLEGAGEEPRTRRGRRPRRELHACAAPDRRDWRGDRSCAPCASPRRSCPRSLFPLFLLAVNASGLERPPSTPGLPDRLLPHLRAGGAVHPGRRCSPPSNSGSDLARDIETGFLDRLALTPMSGVSLITGQLAGRGGARARSRACSTWSSACWPARTSRPAWPACRCCSPSRWRSCSRSAASGIFAALRLGTGEAVQGMFPLFFVFLFLSSMALPRDLIEQDWFRTIATLQPGLLSDRGGSQPVHRRLRRPGARARASASRRSSARCSWRASSAGAAIEDGAHVTGPRYRSVALAVAWRNLHNFFLNPGAAAARAAVPAVLLHGVRGRASRASRRPAELRLPVGLHRVPVRRSCCMQASAFGGVFTGLRHRARLRVGLRPADDARRRPTGAPSSRGYAIVGARARAVRAGRCCSRSRWPPGCRWAAGWRPVRHLRAGAVRQLRGAHVVGRDRAALPLDPGRAADADPDLPGAVPRAGVRAARPARGLGARGGAQ